MLLVSFLWCIQVSKKINALFDNEKNLKAKLANLEARRSISTNYKAVSGGYKCIARSFNFLPVGHLGHGVIAVYILRLFSGGAYESSNAACEVIVIHWPLLTREAWTLQSRPWRHRSLGACLTKITHFKKSNLTFIVNSLQVYSWCQGSTHATTTTATLKVSPIVYAVRYL